MASQFICPQTFKSYSLPPRLLKDNKNREGRWRYRGLDGLKTITFYTKTDEKYIETEKAIAYALQLNEHHFNEAPAHGFLKAVEVEEGSMMEGVNMFIEYYEATHQSKVGTDYWVQAQRDLKICIRELNTSSDKVTRKMFKDWWAAAGKFNNLDHSYDFQKRTRPVLRRFLDWSRDDFPMPNVDSNPFIPQTTGAAMLPEKPQKVRTVLMLDEYHIMLQAAIKDGNDWFVMAMKLGLLTCLRLNDVVNMTYGGCMSDSGDKLHVVIGKSEAKLGKTRAASVEWDLHSTDDNAIKQLLDLSYSRRHLVATTNPKYTTPALHVLHKKPLKPGIAAKSKAKSHYSQLSKRDVQDTFAHYRDLVPRIKALPMKAKPGFHELRALATELMFDEGNMTLESISAILGHDNVETLKENYATHIQANKRVVKEVSTALVDAVSLRNKIRGA